MVASGADTANCVDSENESGLLSPNQLWKRDLIIDAAARVLLEDGLQGCTARRIADASPLTKSAVHYYFSDVDEIIGLASIRLLERLLDRLQQVADAAETPIEGFWSAMELYCAPFPKQSQLFNLEWHAHLIRKGDVEPNRRMGARLEKFFADLLERSGEPNHVDKAFILCTYLIGVKLRLTMEPCDFSEIRKEFQAVCNLRG